LQRYSCDTNFRDISLWVAARNFGMESEKVGGILGAIVAAIVLAIAFAYGPMGPFGKPAKQLQTNQAPKAPPGPPPVRGPVIRDVPQ